MRFFGGFAKLAAVCAALASFACGGAQAAGRQPARDAIPSATAISVGEATSTPWGWLDFCGRYERECRGGLASPVDVVLTPKVWGLVVMVNARVNAAIRPLSDVEHWGVVDRWDLPEDGHGDCEDYALLKRKLLIAAGLPRQAVLMTIVKDEKGEGHAVLTVKTNRGDFILDNMRDGVHAWDELPYRFVKRQSQGDPNVWVQIGEPTSAPLIVSR